MVDVSIGSRTHELRVFTGSAEDARKFAAALVVPAGLEVRIGDAPEATERTVAENRIEMKRLRSTIARAERLRDIWLTYPPGNMHHAAGLMLAKYLSGEAFQADALTEETDRG